MILLNQGGKSEEWKTALTTARDLIWSVTAPLDNINRQRLVKLTPNLGKRLQDGLESISFDPFQRKELFRQLKDFYVERIKSSRQPETAQTAAEPSQPQTVEAAPRQETVKEQETITHQPTVEEQFLLDQVDRLNTGTWFEMQENDKRFRCRLAAILKATGKYIFVNRAGMKIAEHNREQLAQSLKNGHLTQLDDGVLFDRALEAVITDLHVRRTSSA